MSTPAIEIDTLVKRFPGSDAPVLKGISLSVNRGDIYGIIGRSGAGKSTLVRCINLLEQPTSGSIRVAGREITGLAGKALREARRDVGMVFQHFNILSSRTVADNVALPLEVAGVSAAEIAKRVPPLLDLVGLADKRGLYPAQLSGGQKQRVGIARALASRPSVLLCDEATSALDPETTQSILTLLRDINRELALTILLITHEMQVVRDIASHVAVLDAGEVVEEGETFDIFARPASPVARTFLADLTAHDLPPLVAKKLLPTADAGTDPVLRILFQGESANEPILADLIQRFGFRPNILHGRIDYIQGRPLGVLTVIAEQGSATLAPALAYLQSKNLSAEVIGHVRHARHAAA